MRADTQEVVNKYKVNVFGAKSDIDKAEDMLSDSEKVIFMTPANVGISYSDGRRKEKVSGVYLVSDKRSILSYESGNDVYDLDAITDVTFGGSLLGGGSIKIFFNDSKQYSVIYSFNKAIMADIQDAIMDAVSAYTPGETEESKKSEPAKPPETSFEHTEREKPAISENKQMEPSVDAVNTPQNEFANRPAFNPSPVQNNLSPQAPTVQDKVETQPVPPAGTPAFQQGMPPQNNPMFRPEMPPNTPAFQQGMPPQNNPMFRPEMPPNNPAFQPGMAPNNSAFQPGMAPNNSAFQPGMAQNNPAFQPGAAPNNPAFQPGMPLNAPAFQQGMPPQNNPMFRPAMPQAGVMPPYPNGYAPEKPPQPKVEPVANKEQPPVVSPSGLNSDVPTVGQAMSKDQLGDIGNKNLFGAAEESTTPAFMNPQNVPPVMHPQPAPFGGSSFNPGAPASFSGVQMNPNNQAQTASPFMNPQNINAPQNNMQMNMPQNNIQGPSPYVVLEKLDRLKELGTITPEDYERKREEILKNI